MTKIFLDKNQSLCWKQILDIDFFKIKMKWFTDFVFDSDIQFVNSIDDCDVYITECSNLRIISNKLNIIICGESDNRLKYNFYMNLYRHNNNVKFIGTVEDSDISFNIPILNIERDNCFDPYCIHINEKNNFNDRYIINNINSCFVRKNITADIREQIGNIIETKRINGQNKDLLISNYVFNYCPENSLSKFNGKNGYITEKVYDAIINRCIPIYYGGNIEKYSFLNSKRIIKIDLKNVNQIKEYIKNISKNDLEKIFNLKILRDDYNEFVKFRKINLRNFIIK